MKQRYTLFLILSMLSAGLSGQAFKDFKIPEKPARADRPSAYRDLLESYRVYDLQTSKKSALEFSLSLDTAQIQYLLPNDEYLPIVNEIIRYDAAGNMGRSVVVELNPNTYVWENSTKSDFFYDINGNNNLVIREVWNDGASAWVSDDQIEYSYDANNYLIQVIQSVWNETQGQFSNTARLDYTRSGSGLETELLILGWDAAQQTWVEAWKYEYGYDANDLRILETEYAWDEGASDWVFSWKAESSYNETDQLTLIEEFNWDAVNSLWVNSWKSSLSYAAGGNVEQQLDSMYLEPDGPWQAYMQSDYTFDEQNNPLTETYSDWDETSGMLVLNTRYEYLYENETLLADLMAPPISWYWPDYREQIVNKPLGHIGKGYNTDLSDFEIVYQEIYFYNTPGFPLGIETESSPLVNLYPNPVREYLNIDFAGEYPRVFFELFDATGRRVLVKQVQKGERLNLEGIEDGLYLYRISGEELIQSGKLLKE